MANSSRLLGQPLMTERLPSGDRRILRQLRVRVGQGTASESVEIPESFVTDFSSIPWFARFLVDWSKVDIAGVVHDYLYSIDGQQNYRHTRSGADLIWFRVAISGSRRANLLQAGVCWFFIRACGRMFFLKR